MAANNCTIELVHGGTVHLQEDYDHVVQWLNDPHSRLLHFKRMAGFANRKAHDFPDVAINPAHVVGVYPLETHSAHPDRGILAQFSGAVGKP